MVVDKNCDEIADFFELVSNFLTNIIAWVDYIFSNEILIFRYKQYFKK